MKKLILFLVLLTTTATAQSIGDRLDIIEEQKKRQAEQKAREKALDQIIKKEMDESGISDKLKKEKDKIDKE